MAGFIEETWSRYNEVYTQVLEETKTWGISSAARDAAAQVSARAVYKKWKRQTPD